MWYNPNVIVELKITATILTIGAKYHGNINIVIISFHDIFDDATHHYAVVYYNAEVPPSRTHSAWSSLLN